MDDFDFLRQSYAVSDQALKLLRELRDNHQTTTRYIAGARSAIADSYRILELWRRIESQS